MLEVDSIDHREEPDRNWRDTYHEMIGHTRQYLRDARAAGDTRPEFFDWQRWIPKDMTDAQIEWLARRMSERAVERAINQRRAREGRAKARRGEAF